MLYLYALVESTAALPDDVELVSIQGIGAVVGDIDDVVDPTDEHVLSHARIVDRLATLNDAVLPVRFGRGFREPDELEAALGRLAPQLEERLRAVRGCVELGVHVVGAAPPMSGIEVGADYMRRRLREVAEGEALADEIHVPLAERSRESTRNGSVAPAALLRAAYLVPRGDVDAFCGAVESAQQRHPELTFACTGPWPPYSFANVEAANEQ
jgi:hypothetical protein